MNRIADLKLLLNDKQKEIYAEFQYENYVTRLMNENATLSREKIFEIEYHTRGQSENPLWLLMRINRKTASMSGAHTLSSSVDVFNCGAMSYGLFQEEKVKDNKIVIQHIETLIENELKAKIVQTVLNCGMILSKYGLCSASPDSYFLLDNGQIVPLEIKCPITYRNVTVEEMRASLGVRKNRYRVKHTALSVNTKNVPVFCVEKTDPHYRQMQRQMYVMNAPMAVYLVKFKDSIVISTVKRDAQFCDKELRSEKYMFASYVTNNKNDDRLDHQYFRIESLKVCPSLPFDESVAARLTRQGFYYSFGKLVCAFCAKRFDIDTDPDTVFAMHGDGGGDCENNARNKKLMMKKHENYLSIATRMCTLPTDKTHLARLGVFCDAADSNRYKLFCCDGIVQVDPEIVVGHLNNCDFVQQQ
uniref:Alk-exo alkaline exonuclease n=1 Tax=Spodoptera littoralis nuclear polyhedrosis virus TaxID=10456 RepID=A0A3G4S908_NPVSL|nr:alk-exo alkaline exonuclease [Spodoptera littoralis nucleopolyhedrovirus]